MARFLNDRKAATGKIPGSLIHLGTKKTDRNLIRFFNFSSENLVENEAEKLEDCLPLISEDSVSWIGIYGLHNADLIQRLGELFEIHSLLLEDMLNTDQRPKITEAGKLLVIILKVLNYDDKLKELTSEQMTLILDDSFLITLQEKEGGHFDAIRERIRKGTRA